MRHSGHLMAMILFLVAAAAPAAGATVFTLTDDNSTFQIDSYLGADLWTVDGVSQLHDQGFWIRLGDTSPEDRLGNWYHSGDVDPSGTIATLVFVHSLFEVAITYVLCGGAQGTGTSRVTETIRISNTAMFGIAPRFFQYADFDLAETWEDDTLRVQTGRAIWQTDDEEPVGLSAGALSPEPAFHQGALFAELRNLLDDVYPTTLTNVPPIMGGAIEGDVTWAYQWNTTLGVDEDIVLTVLFDIVSNPPPDVTAPSIVSDLQAGAPTPDGLGLSWTAVGDDGMDGTASQYDIRYATSASTPWDEMTPISGEPAPQAAGLPESFQVMGLEPSTTYYFRLKVADEVPNWSDVSNQATGTAPACWPYLLSYADFEGISRTTSGSYPVTLGLYSTTGAPAVVEEVSAGCWHLPMQNITLPDDGCGTAQIDIFFDPAEEDCGLVYDLPIRVTSGSVTKEATHRVVADNGLLDAGDLGGCGWGDFGGLEGLLNAYAPVLKHNAGEKYGPVRIEVSLHDATLSPNPYVAPPDLPQFVDSEIIPDDLAQYSWSFFSIDLPCNEQDPDGCESAYEAALGAATDPDYAVYATATRDVGASLTDPADDYIVLQYWMHYYFNDNETRFCGTPPFDYIREVHECDWEHISILLELDLDPVQVAFDAHGYVTPKAWSEVDTYLDSEHPIVYVAKGGHGTYWEPNWSCARPFSTYEEHWGNGPCFCPPGVPGGEVYDLQILPRWDDLTGFGVLNRWIEFSGYWGMGSPLQERERERPRFLFPWKVYPGPAFRECWANPTGTEFKEFCAVAASPVDILVRDPLGRETGPDTLGIPSSHYEVSVVDTSGIEVHRSARVRIAFPLAGEYSIEVLPIEGAPEDATYSLWATRNWVGAPPESILLAQDVALADIPAGGYQCVPDVPHVGQSLVIPDSWDVDWASDDSLAVEWRLSSPGGLFVVDDLIPESLRLNGTVAPIGEIQIQGLILVAQFPRGPAVESIENHESGTSRQVMLTGLFADSLLRLEAPAVVTLYGSAASVGVSEKAGGFRASVSGPNIFTGRLAMQVTLPGPGALDVTIIDVAGRHVRTLVNAEYPRGTHMLVWDGSKDDGQSAPAGVYFVRSSFRGRTETRRSMLIR